MSPMFGVPETCGFCVDCHGPDDPKARPAGADYRLSRTMRLTANTRSRSCAFTPAGGKCTRCRITGQRSYHMPHRSRRWRRRRGSGRESSSTTSRPFFASGKSFFTSERRTRQGKHECVRTTRMRRGNYACIGITMRVSVRCPAWTRATGQCGARIRAAGNRRRAHESGAGHAAGVRWRRRPSG